jgi:hypothetical protein
MSGKKKAIIISSAALTVISASALYLWKNPETLVTEKTVRMAGEQMGFNMQDAGVFKRQLRSEIEKIDMKALSSEEKAEYFREFVNPAHIKSAARALSRLPDEFREEAVNAASALMKEFTAGLTTSDRAAISKYGKTAEGKRNVEGARSFLKGLPPSRIKQIEPLIQEFERIAAIALR